MNNQADDIEFGTDAWYARRARLYADDAARIVGEVSRYEDVHPDDAPCLIPLLQEVLREIRPTDDSGYWAWEFTVLWKELTERGWIDADLIEQFGKVLHNAKLVAVAPGPVR